MSNTWENFLVENRVTVNTAACQDTSSSSELDEFELTTGITLPQDYRDFRRFLGTGEFMEKPCEEGDFGHCNLRIEKPNKVYSDQIILILSQDLDYQIEIGEFRDHPEESFVVSLLKSSFLLAGNSKGHFFVWHLNSWTEADESYDIYLIPPNDSPLNCYLVGRSFSEFIKDFGIGKKRYSKLPKRLKPRTYKSPVFFTYLPISASE